MCEDSATNCQYGNLKQSPGNRITPCSVLRFTMVLLHVVRSQSKQKIAQAGCVRRLFHFWLWHSRYRF